MKTLLAAGLVMGLFAVSTGVQPREMSAREAGRTALLTSGCPALPGLTGAAGCPVTGETRAD